MSEDELPPELKRAAAGLILTVLGGILGSALFFYLIYRLYISFRWGYR